MARKTKRELILEVFETEGFQELAYNEIQTINERLVAIYGRGGAASPAYIANTLTAAGKRIHYQTDFATLDETSEYEQEFVNVLKLDNLDNAEDSLRFIDQVFRQYQMANNQDGIARCRKVAERARLRAQLLATNEQLGEQQRCIKKEIAFWFSLWLRTPDLFEHWLELRKRSAEFLHQFSQTGDVND